ncbi:hypothetical protein PVAP13_2NG555100 [Panicum virgatum]|nr:hypothetical protein PVAP13_2NG555100 [Panicum virgatum]
MAHLSTFLPALLDAFENHSPYFRKARHPSSDVARAAEAWSGDRQGNRGCIVAGRSLLMARGRCGNMFQHERELKHSTATSAGQHAAYEITMMGSVPTLFK